MPSTAPSLLSLQVRIVLAGGLAIAIMAVCAFHIFGQSPNPNFTNAEAVVQAARWLVLPGASLLVGIIFVANFRFLHKNEIDGRTESASQTFEVALRYNRNTIEQLALAAIAWFGLASTAPERTVAAFPVLAGLFVIGRITFWFGYMLAPEARAFGFVLTFLPNAALIIWQIARLI